LRQISGWKFDNLDITIRQRLSEALYTAGHIKEAGESLLNIVDTVGEEVYVARPITTWLLGESCFTRPSVMRSKFHQFSPNDVSPPPRVVERHPSTHSPLRRS